MFVHALLEMWRVRNFLCILSLSNLFHLIEINNHTLLTVKCYTVTLIN